MQEGATRNYLAQDRNQPVSGCPEEFWWTFWLHGRRIICWKSQGLSALLEELCFMGSNREGLTAANVKLGFPLEVQLQPFLTFGIRCTWVLRATMGCCPSVEGAHRRQSWDKTAGRPKTSVRTQFWRKPLHCLWFRTQILLSSNRLYNHYRQKSGPFSYVIGKIYRMKIMFSICIL